MAITGNQSKKESLPQQLDALNKSLLCVRLVRSRRAKDVVVLDLRARVSFADYFVICTGLSDRQVQAIVQYLEKELSVYHFRPRSIEGYTKGQWVLIDYDDVIVHVFQKPMREFYDLEGLWSDAPTVSLPPDTEEEIEEDCPNDED